MRVTYRPSRYHRELSFFHIAAPRIDRSIDRFRLEEQLIIRRTKSLSFSDLYFNIITNGKQSDVMFTQIRLFLTISAKIYLSPVSISLLSIYILTMLTPADVVTNHGLTRVITVIILMGTNNRKLRIMPLKAPHHRLRTTTLCSLSCGKRQSSTYVPQDSTLAVLSDPIVDVE